MLKYVDTDIQVSSVVSSCVKNILLVTKMMIIKSNQTRALCKKFDDETKWIDFLIKGDDLLKNIVIFGTLVL